MDVCLLLCAMATLQLHSSLASTPRPSSTQPCLEANYESGCRRQDGACEFSVSWRRETADQAFRIQLTSLVPELKEKDVWTLGLSFTGATLKGDLKCLWSANRFYHNCSVGSEGGGEGGTVGCLSANITYHSRRLECRFVLPDSSPWSDLFSKPVSLHITTGNASGSTVRFRQDSSQCHCDVGDCGSGCDLCTVTSVGSKCPSLFDLLLIRSHAILMVLSFLLLLPTGVLISRYSRPIFPHTWFRAHVVANSAGVVLTTLGLAAVLGHTRGSFSMGFHQMVGIICISLLLFQALCGFLRPETGTSLRRRIFKIVHRTLGAVILGLGTLALVLGGVMYKNSVYGVVVAVLVVAIVVEAGFMVAMELITRKNHMILPPVGYHRVKGEGEGETGENDVEELYTRGGKGREKHQVDTNWKPLHGHTATKRVLLAFVVQAFLFSGVLGILILYGSH